MNESRKLSIVFPYYYGPKIFEYGAALLWFGQLDCVMMPWASSNPVIVFEQLAKRAKERELPLAELFHITGNWFKESCLAIAAVSKELEQLDDSVTRLAGVGPGGQGHYLQIRQDLDAAVEIAFTLLDDLELLRIAGCQFIWRCYEYYLEMSNCQDAVLDALSREESVVQGKSRLLAECLVNHYAYFFPTVAAVVVENRATVNILAKCGERVLEGIDHVSIAESSKFQREYLASTVFENTLSNLCPPITSETCGRYHKVLEEKADVIESAKRKCYLAADKLLDIRSKPDSFETLLGQTLADMQSEVQEIAEIDKVAWRTFTGQLLEDRVLWAGAAGFLGGLTGVLPPVTLAAAAVTLFSTMATKGIMEIRRKAKTLKQSDWCFVYELNKRRRPFAATRLGE
jgi:hypothetical protein